MKKVTKYRWNLNGGYWEKYREIEITEEQLDNILRKGVEVVMDFYKYEIDNGTVIYSSNANLFD